MTVLDPSPHTLLYLAHSGSHLFGTSTPQSDLDFRGLFLPTRASLYLQAAPQQLSANSKADSATHKNTAEDVDASVWSLQMWLRLLEKGDLNAVSLLFSWTHPGAVVGGDPAFLERLRTLEHTRLLSRKLSGMVSFVASQAVKYTDKGKHFRVVELVCQVLERAAPQARIQDLLEEIFAQAEQELFGGWAELLYTEQVTPDSPRMQGSLGQLVVLDRRYDLTAGAHWAERSLRPLLERYGHRAREASQQGVDFKAFSHSLRVLEEVRLLHLHGRLEYPHRPDFARFLTEVKQGQHPYALLVQQLENRLLEAEAAAEHSLLPLEFDREYAQSLVLEQYGL